jgi:hypothetical protein
VAEEITHAVRASMAGRAVIYALGDTALSWRDDRGQGGSLAYADVASVRLIGYVGGSGTMYRCAIKGGGMIRKIPSHHFAGFGRVEDRTATYAPFVRALTERVAAHAPQARFIAGSTGLWITWLLIGVGALVVLALMAVILAGGEFIAAGGIPALLVLIVGIPLMVREVRKGGAKFFDPANPPPALLGAS